MTEFLYWIKNINKRRITEYEAQNILEKFRKNSYFKGIRPMIQDIADVNWMLKTELSPVFEFLIDNNLTFDALVKAEHLDALYQLLIRYPELNVVIDHGAKPDIANNLVQDWFDKITLIAYETSAYCKLSGLVTEANDNASLTELAPYMEHLLIKFGASRLMWGSDWPVVNLSSDYPRWVKQVETFVEPLTDKQQQSIWCNTAKEFYGLE